MLRQSLNRSRKEYFDLITHIAICDDNRTTAEIVSGSVEKIFAQHGEQVKISVYHSAKDFIRDMTGHVFDLVLLDIEMPGSDGVEIARMLRRNDNPADIVFVSAREDRVFETFEVHPFGFVRKSTFVKDISLVIDAFISMRNNNLASSENRTLVVSTRDGTSSIPINKIIYIEGCRKEQLAYMTNLDKPVVFCSSMEKLEQKLCDSGFIRVHKGYIVNYSYIGVIGQTDITLTTGDVLPLSRRKKQEVKEQYMTCVRESGMAIV